ncbi:MAG: hypothetical protein UY70_C0008G0009 [Candidatus Kaiserbacteria bacterium GW2011_GWB1_52_6]|uniref:Nucleotidyl transferase AbiEii/AbiGii toxin family protein n=3 Tax=Candidatus Kaiseribacteriota TaxID=1752734 RepID=A0A0G1XDV6_9BACT|nr:MAG: hypothetical protein UY67_C0031G0009 [Candidatus Kaiserbacteria bacterium GW2011_GWA2_52_12]KKW27730.1 MAG: hypothetical protein UY70_C0008G0009 [Candidatus Kaiserbacteria bacterium GW2011_GWB1_52_6]KKW29473.1 MAG: hypothetical protein UY74_C0074G0009 [Candidatus Kaiserbacteria bacterium GW2011_GWC2_52_8b]
MAQSILTPDQQKLLTLIAAQESMCRSFYLGGGTALAEFYLHHRLSEDLDFFSEEEPDVEGISTMFKKISEAAGIQNIEYQQSFNRNLFLLTLKSSEVKTEFTYYPFTRIEKGMRVEKLAVDSLLDIAVNKVFTIYQKPRSRDFIDLFCILQRETSWTLPDLILKAQAKFDHHIDPLQMSAQCVKSETLKDYPVMKIALREDEWIGFFLNQAKVLAKSQLE